MKNKIIIKLPCKIELNTEYYISTENKTKKIKYETGSNKIRKIYFDNKIIDGKWLNTIILAYKKNDKRRIAKNIKYLELYYTLLYLREDTPEYEFCINRLLEKFQNKNLLNILKIFLENNKYKLRYSYKTTNYLNRNTVVKLSTGTVILIRYYTVRYLRTVKKEILKIYKKLLIKTNIKKSANRENLLKYENNFVSCNKILVNNSASSCHFYCAKDKFGKKYFIKDCEIKQLDSIEREKTASKLLSRFSNNYLINKADQKSSYIVLSFESAPTLKEYIENHKIDTYFVAQLVKFSETVLDELLSVGLIHRDIRPDNILVYCANGKYSFKLIDFGCSIKVDNPQLLKNSIFNLDFHTAGINYRAGIKTWDDAGSFYKMIKEIIETNRIKESMPLNRIVSKIGRIYYIEDERI